MATYKNGQIPARLLIRRGNFLLTAGTWAKVDALVADVKKRHGVTLRITDGVGVMKGTGAYRGLAMQRAVKKHYTALGRPWQAADEGTSSHGGEFKGADALAVDITNYYLISRADFYAAARRAKFEPGYFDGKNGRPLEPWHIIDRDPYRRVAATTGDEDMPLTKEDIDKVAKAVWNYLIQPQDESGNYVKGSFPARGFLSSAAAQAQVAARETAPRVWAHLVQAQDAQGNLLTHEDGTPVVWPARGYLASTNAQVGGTLPDVDETAIAEALAPLLSTNLGALSDEDVARIASAAADEQARRLAG